VPTALKTVQVVLKNRTGSAQSISASGGAVNRYLVTVPNLRLAVRSEGDLYNHPYYYSQKHATKAKGRNRWSLLPVLSHTAEGFGSSDSPSRHNSKHLFEEFTGKGSLSHFGKDYETDEDVLQVLVEDSEYPSPTQQKK